MGGVSVSQADVLGCWEPQPQATGGPWLGLLRALPAWTPAAGGSWLSAPPWGPSPPRPSALGKL